MSVSEGPARRGAWVPRLGPATLAAACVVLAMSSADAGIGPDAAANLRMATAMARGDGLLQPAATPTGQAWFGTWPPGYPALVAVGVLGGLDPWWASKLVGTGALLTCAALLRRLRPDDPTAALAPLGFASVLHTFAGSASEGPFVACLLALAWVLAEPMRASRRASWAAVLGLTAFLLRYIGVLVVPVFFAGGVLAFRRGERAQALGLWAATLPTVAAGWWLGRLNLEHTGHLTGVARLPAPESWSAWGAALGRGVFASLVPTVRVLSSAPEALLALLVGMGVLAAGLLSVWRAPDRSMPAWTAQSRALVGVGGTYLLLLVVLRGVRHFDLFTTRLLAPATLLGLAALVAAVGTLPPIARRRADAALGTACLVGVVAALVLARSPSGGSAHDTLARMAHDYRDVVRGCVVGPHPVQLPMVRPDLIPAMPHAPPYQAEAESVEAFSARLLNTPWPCVRLDRRVPLDPRRYHPSWFDPDDPHAGTLQVLR